MRSGLGAISTASARRVWRAPRALLWLWSAQILFAAGGLLALRGALGDAWAHRPAPGLFELASLAISERSPLVMPLLVAGLMLALYGIASPVLHGVVLRQLTPEAVEAPSTARVALPLLRLALVFTLARGAVAALWLLSWPQLDRLSQHLADERWQLLLLLAFGAAGLLLWCWLSLLLRHATAALALGLAPNIRSAARLVARAQHANAALMWSCWLMERAVWLATLMAGFALHLPTLPLTWGVALLLEALVVTRLTTRLWGLAAATEVLLAGQGRPSDNLSSNASATVEARA